MLIHVEQERRMRWILFLVFVALFVVIVLGTLAAVFLDFGNLKEQHRNILFNVFLVEVGAAVIALFYSIFGLKRKDEVRERKVRLNLGELQDIRKLVGKTALLAPSQINGVSLEEIETTILDDNGPYLPLDLPPAAYAVYVAVASGDKRYSGSFLVGTHLVDMFEEQG